MQQMVISKYKYIKYGHVSVAQSSMSVIVCDWDMYSTSQTCRFCCYSSFYHWSQCCCLYNGAAVSTSHWVTVISTVILLLTHIQTRTHAREFPSFFLPLPTFMTFFFLLLNKITQETSPAFVCNIKNTESLDKNIVWYTTWSIKRTKIFQGQKWLCRNFMNQTAFIWWQEKSEGVVVWQKTERSGKKKNSREMEEQSVNIYRRGWEDTGRVCVNLWKYVYQQFQITNSCW